MRLWLMTGPLLLTISGGVLYHLAAKAIPKTIDPPMALVVAYTTALAASLVAYVLLSGSSPTASPVRPWHPAVLVMGIAAFLIEIGYVLAYRSALPVSTTSVLTSGMVAALLVPVGMGFFGERLSAANGIGLALCLIGLALLRR